MADLYFVPYTLKTSESQSGVLRLRCIPHDRQSLKGREEANRHLFISSRKTSKQAKISSITF